ncbi:hypothetical protein [Actinocorallia aurantiaca]|uniref:Uncharacterized protein n=1 Tax=Actinocorallia aurantiaca TaxID=46204 RepID=A0ABN3U3Q4_9ACTN
MNLTTELRRLTRGNARSAARGRSRGVFNLNHRGARPAAASRTRRGRTTGGPLAQVKGVFRRFRRTLR